MSMQKKQQKKFVVEEFHLIGGWTAIEGSSSKGSTCDELVTYPTEKAAEKALKDMVKEFTDAGLEYDEEEFRVRELDDRTRLRPGLCKVDR